MATTKGELISKLAWATHKWPHEDLRQAVLYLAEHMSLPHLQRLADDEIFKGMK